jgi:DNA adenine methylase
LRYVSPLRYPGGKARLTDFVEEIISVNKLADGHYAEPYAGGAAIAMALLLREVVQTVHLNDLDRSVYAFWHSVLNRTDELCDLVVTTRLSVREWERQRDVQQRRGRAGLLELGFSTFFLNRTNRSGILDGGMIGGKDQRGKWKIDARYNAPELVERIQRIAGYRDRISLYRKDACDFLREIVPGLPQRSFVYLDPPYFKKGRDLYYSHYRPEDHAAVAGQVLQNLDRPWMVSYDDVPEICKLYRGVRRRRYELPYSAGSHRHDTEVIFFADGLTIPRMPKARAEA